MRPARPLRARLNSPQTGLALENKQSTALAPSVGRALDSRYQSVPDSSRPSASGVSHPQALRGAPGTGAKGVAETKPVIGDPSALCCSVVQAAVEVLRGIRPLAQLSRWLSPDVYEALARRREITTAAGAPRSTLQARIRRARVIRVTETAAEATVIVQDEHRVRAAAIRVEHMRGNWRVVAFELG